LWIEEQVSAPSTSIIWPSSRDFVEAIQNPKSAFRNPELRECQPALDRFGMPLVASGNFAYAFKLRDTVTGKATGVRCFRGFIPDRDKRYSLIDVHLNAHPNNALTSFDFEAEGITIGGRKYPIVLMEWIEGPALDSYIEQALGNKVALQQLADRWLKVIESLRASQVAHGDLQHGNIIVQAGECRLIDFDGMFVPGMKGWRSNEIGHPHYQHPKRDAHDFGETLDNFSAIVIYLSLISLAEAPDLWKTCHDENLIFTKPDFIDPNRSKLFAQVRKLGGIHAQLCDVLASACAGPAVNTPYLLNLVTRKSKLPSWMIADAKLDVQVKSREVKPGQAIAQPVTVSPSPAQHAPNFTFQGVASSTTQYQPGLDWNKVHRLSWPRALKIGFVGLFLFWIWVPLLSGVGEGMGIAKDDVFGFVFWAYIIGCVLIAYAFTIHKEQQPAPAKSPVSPQIPRYIPPVTSQRYAPRANVLHYGAAVVGSKIRNIYHRPSCEWALKMSHRNRITFNSANEAIHKGYRACKMCRP
jgi:hypothetical protein